MFVVSVLPKLKKLDFTVITGAEREQSETWRTVHASKRLGKMIKKRKKQKTEAGAANDSSHSALAPQETA